MKSIIYIILLLISSINPTFAQTISITSDTLTNTDGNITIKLSTTDNKQLPKNFRIKVISDNLSLSIWNKASKNLVQSTGLWYYQPIIAPELQVNIMSENFIESAIYILVQDINTGRVTKSSAIIVNDGNWYRRYLDTLNKSMKAL